MQVRPQARRLIHAVLVNHEYDLLEARVNMLKDVVDVFVLQVKQNIKILTVFETYNCCIHIIKHETIFFYYRSQISQPLEPRNHFIFSKSFRKAGCQNFKIRYIIDIL